MTEKPTKLRLDQLLVDRGLVETRSQAQGLILAGQVLSENRVLDKPGLQVKSDIPLSLKEQLRYVSRGGLKLEKALAAFGIDPTGRIAMDVGASTGGFTDCLLQQGAVGVHAIDVGTNQLDWRLRQDPRVFVQEQTHILKIEPGSLVPAPSLAVIDVAFIGLLKVLPHVGQCLAFGAAPPHETVEPPHSSVGDGFKPSRIPVQTGGFETRPYEDCKFDQKTPQIIALIKPQFEFETYCGKHSRFKGVVSQEADIRVILTGVLTDIATQMPDWPIQGLVESPITGPKGNREFLIVLGGPPAPVQHAPEDWVESLFSEFVTKLP